MSRRTEPMETYPSNTKINPIPPLRPTQGRGAANPTAGIPQRQTGRTAAQTKRKEQRNTIPLSRQLYREALETQAGNPQSPVIKTTGQITEKTWKGQKPESSALPNRRQKEMRPQEKQPLPQGRPKRPDRLWKKEEEESEEERHQRELEEEERRREEREAREEKSRKHWERIEQERKRYEEQQQRRKRWEGFGDQFQDILETGKNALAGEWNGFWNYMTGKDWKQYWQDHANTEREKLSDTWNFFQDPFAALGNFYAGEAPSTDNEFLQKMAKEGALLREIISDPMPFLGNYLTGEAAVTDGESLQRAAENGRKSNLLNYLRYYVDSLLAGGLAEADSLFGKEENNWLTRGRKGLLEEARENYDRIVDSSPPYLREKNKLSIATIDVWTDALLSMAGNIPPELSRATREYGKAMEEAEKKGYSRFVQTAYALEKAIQEYYNTQTKGYDLNDKDRGFLKAFGEYISKKKEIIGVFENVGVNGLSDMLESVLMLAEEGLDCVLKGVQEPDPRDIPDIFDDMIDGLLDRTEEKVDAWEKEAWAPKETLPEEIWGLPEYDRSNGADSGALLPAGGETDAGGLWELPEETENTGNPDENWYTGDEEKHIPPQGPLLPNTTYQAGEFGYTYQTDEQGRISNWHADELQLTDRTGRLPYVRNTPGKQPGDHAGHLAGDRFGGTGGLDNLVSQYWLVNLSSYRKLENDWKRAIQDGKNVDVNVRVEYNGSDLRPSAFSIEYTIDGATEKKYITNDFWGGLSS